MKPIFLLLFFMISSVEAKQIVLNVSDQDIAIIENDVVDFEQWIQDAWNGKLNKCRERLIRQEINRSIQENSLIPLGEDLIIEKALNRPDYKNKKSRELENIRAR